MSSSLVRLGPDEHVYEPLRYRLRRRDVDVSVSASRAVDVLLLEPDEYRAFADGEDYRPAFASRRKREHAISVRVPSRTKWYLVIVNWNRTRRVTAEVEVWGA